MKILSVIVPCYNEEAVIENTHQRLSDVLSKLVEFQFEIIYVNDGSTDKTLTCLDKIASEDKAVKILSFSRNFGHQPAISAGLAHCSGSVAIIIDADLQDPPELISKMIDMWKKDFQVVYGKRRTRKEEGWFKLLSAKFFYRFINILSDIEIPVNTGDFRLMDRRIIDILNVMPEKYRFVRGMVSWAGFKQCEIIYDRNSRFAGDSKYPMKRMLKLAADGIFSFSLVPLRVASWIGASTALLSVIGIIYAFLNRILTKNWVPGWTLLFIAVMFLGGVTLLVLGIIGEYIGRIYGEVKQRPLYLIESKTGFDQ